jgi:hypothetical protein
MLTRSGSFSNCPVPRGFGAFISPSSTTERVWLTRVVVRRAGLAELFRNLESFLAMSFASWIVDGSSIGRLASVA